MDSESNGALMVIVGLALLGLTLFVGFIFLILKILQKGLKQQEERRKGFADVAMRLGLSFSPGDSQDIINELCDFSLFTEGDSRHTQNVLEGEIDGINWKIFEYKYNVYGGETSSTWYCTVAYARFKDFSFPKFSLGPESTLHKLGDVFGIQDIDFISHPLFSDKYLLKGPDENAVRKLFAPSVLDYFEKNLESLNHLRFFGEGNRLVIATNTANSLQSCVQPQDIPEFLEIAHRTALVFRQENSFNLQGK